MLSKDNEYKHDVLDELWAKQKQDRIDEKEKIRKDEEKNEFSSLPNINLELLVKALPEVVVNYLSRYEDNNQKDVFILSLIAHISGALPNYFVLHDGDELTTNLNVFITAPAGSGKSAMSHATKFFYSIDDELSKLGEEQEDDNGDEIKPMQKTLFIPGNISSAAITKCLNSNGGRGIICETEADTLGNILSKDWANFDDILRKAFHNEPITMARAGQSKIVKIPNPALSVILTGTPQQVVKLIPSTENGLFSRFLYYYFSSDNSWRNVFSSSDKGKQIANSHDDLSELVTAMYFDRLDGKKIYFNWTKDQALELDDFFSQLLYDSSNIYGTAISSVVYRLGLIATRLGAIISFVNSFWSEIVDSRPKLNETIEADQNTFALVKHLVEVLIDHSQYVFMQLPRSMERSFSENSKKQSFYNMLPNKFTRNEAVHILAPKAFIKSRTADGYLSDFVKSKKLERNFQNDYIKPNKF